MMGGRIRYAWRHRLLLQKASRRFDAPGFGFAFGGACFHWTGEGMVGSLFCTRLLSLLQSPSFFISIFHCCINFNGFLVFLSLMDD